MSYIKLSDLTVDEQKSVVDWYTNHTLGSTVKKFNIKPDELKLLLSQYQIVLHSKAESTRLGCLEKYGVENISQSERYKNRIKTRSKKEVTKSTEKRKQTNIQKYGCEHVLQVDRIKESAKQTCLNRYGSENFATSTGFREALHSANLKKYGVEHPMQLEKYKQQYASTCLEKYGVSNYAKTEIFKQNQLASTLQKFDNSEFQTIFDDRELSIIFLQQHKLSVAELSRYFNVSGPTIEGWLVRNNLKEYVVHTRSSYENEIAELFPNFMRTNRTVLGNGKELDFYDSVNHVAIEFNGTYWHSDVGGTPKNYHFEKSKQAASKGIRLIHIYQYEWDDPRKQPILISMINIAIGNVPEKIFARNCEIKVISNQEAKPFNEKYHLQGHRNAQITYGLFYRNELVQLMSFSKTRYNRNLKSDSEWEIIRGCPGSNNIVVGGVSKLFTHFVREHNPSMVFSYCDFNKFDGRGYEALGMKFVGYTGPDKTWIIDGEAVSRNPSKYHELKEKSEGIIWGAGSKKYIWSKEK